MTDNDEGWGACQNTPKWHYFIEGRSLCHHYMLFGKAELQRGNNESPDNCLSCRRKLEKRRKDD
jgi:hypothetical protein